MYRFCITLIAVSALLVACSEPTPPPPPDSAALLTDARRVLGAETLTTLEFSGNGQDASIGQPWNISEGWPMWDIQDYNRVINFDAMASQQSAVREIADQRKLGGGGAQPDAGPQNQKHNSDQQLRVHSETADLVHTIRFPGSSHQQRPDDHV